MADDTLKRLEERLTRLEAALAQQQTGGGGGGGFTPPGGVVVDPSPYPTQYPGGARWGYYRWPHPIVDPGPWPNPVVDPGPWPTPVVDPAPRPRPVVDPAVFAGQAATATAFGRIGHIADPAPIDLGRLSASQLEAALHSVNAEKARLTAMEALINQHLERAKKQG